MSSGIVYKIDEVKSILSNMGYILLSQTYINDKTKIVFKDENDYILTSKLSNLLSGKIPQPVDIHNPYSINNIQQYIINNDLDTVLLSTEYIDSQSKLLFKCRCGNIFECSYSKFISRKKYFCNTCSLSLKSEKRKHDVEFIKSEYIKYGLKPLFTTYNHCEEKLSCMTGKGYKGYLAYNNLISGCSFGIFKVNNPFLVENINKYIDINQLKCKLETKVIYDLNDELEFICDCGNKFSTTWRSFTTNHISQCQICSKKQSKYSITTEDFLNELNIVYQKEYSFDDCADKSKLHFDFAVFGCQLLLIEVDGELHYKIGYGGIDNLESQQKRDKIKNEYCKINKIKLIRIPYWEFKNNNYKNIIMKGLKEIQLL